MNFETKSKKQGIINSKWDEGEEGIVNLEGQLISALNELNNARKKKK